jgi:beta-N-acetylhexosaminidase
VPFRAAIRAEVRMMMTSHAICPALSPGNERPATLSPEILTTMLRDELAFAGVTVTDALDMAAVGAAQHASASESLDAIRAGSDLLLTTPSMAIDALRAGLRRASATSPIDRAVLTTSKGRIRRLRRWLSHAVVPDLSVVGSAANRSLADEVARRSITEVSVGSSRGPIDQDCVVVQSELENLTPADTTADAGGSLASQLRALGWSPTEQIVGHAPSAPEIERAVAATAGRASIVLVTAAATEPGQIDLVRRVGALASHCTVIVARNPLDLGYLDVPSRSRILCSYGLTASTIRALGAVLTGSERPPGVLPVSRVSEKHGR